MSTWQNHPSQLDPEGQRVAAVTREILGDNYLHFALERMEMVEDQDGVTVKVRLSRSGVGEHVEIDGKGVGLIDAFFEGLTRRFGDEYPSLKTIAVTDFRVGSGFDEAQGRRSDALAVATLRMKNSHGAEFQFERKSTSVTRSSVRVALDALTFFINSERAYVQLHLALKDAKERRRSDLVEKYRGQMGTLVHATSYSDVIERLRDGE
jgi:LeuA allosteric (dimerisation) domain